MRGHEIAIREAEAGRQGGSKNEVRWRGLEQRCAIPRAGKRRHREARQHFGELAKEHQDPGARSESRRNIWLCRRERARRWGAERYDHARVGRSECERVAGTCVRASRSRVQRESLRTANGEGQPGVSRRSEDFERTSQAFLTVYASSRAQPASARLLSEVSSQVGRCPSLARRRRRQGSRFRLYLASQASWGLLAPPTSSCDLTEPRKPAR